MTAKKTPVKKSPIIDLATVKAEPVEPMVPVMLNEAQAILGICEIAMKAPNALQIVQSVAYMQNKFAPLFKEQPKEQPKG